MTVESSVWDFSPLGWLMLFGGLLAVIPLFAVWWRHRQQPLQRRLYALTVLTLFLTFDLVLFGAFTRLTDSGLGCPDWPGCYGNASPLGAHADIAQAQAAMPTGPVTHSKAWVEMVHRYLASGIGFLIFALMVIAWRDWWIHRRLASDKQVQSGNAVFANAAMTPWWPTVTFVWVCIQGAFGALTVTMKLFPAIVTMHLIGGVVLLALLCQQAVRRGQLLGQRSVVVVSQAVRLGVWGVTALLGVQIVLGGWVSTNYAVLACTTFPTCQGSWWPLMDFSQAFQLWRPLGLLRDGSYLSFAGLTAIHYVHRLMAYVVLIALVGLVVKLWSVVALRQPVKWLAILSVLQLLTGLSNVVLGWPLLSAVLHTGGAAGLMAVLVWLLTESGVERPKAMPAMVNQVVERGVIA